MSRAPDIGTSEHHGRPTWSDRVVRSRFSLLVIGAIVLVVGSSVAHVLVLDGSMRTAGNTKVDAVGAGVVADIESQALRAQSVAEMIAFDPVAVEMVAAADQQGLVDRYAARFDRLRATQSIGQIQFHLPGAVSLVRLHDPSRFGDDLSDFRPTIVAAQRSGEVERGIERGVAGLLVRAVVPMGDRGQIVGSVEAAVALDQSFLERLAPGVWAEIHVVIDERVPSPTQTTTDERVIELADGTPATVARVASTVNGPDLIGAVDLAEVASDGRRFVDARIGEAHVRAGVWPIIDASGEIAGFLVVASEVDTFLSISTLGRWQTAATTLVMAFVLGVVALLERRHRRRLAAHRSLLEFESRLDRALRHARGEADVGAVVAHAMDAVAPGMRYRLLLTDAGSGETTVVADAGLPVLPNGPPSALECAAMVTGEAQEYDRGDALDSCRYLHQDAVVHPDCAGLGARCQPVMIEGTAVGVLHVRRPVESAAVDERVRLLARRAGERIGALRAHAHTELMASTDPLTNLGTRRTTETRVAQLLLEGLPYAVLIVDIDHLANLNSTHGHAAGDRALQALSRVIGDCVRTVDIVGRWSAAQFVVVMPGSEEVAAVMVAEQIREQLAERLASMDTPWFTVSIGVSVSGWVDEPDSALGFDRVVHTADRSLASAKSTGRNRVVVWSDLGDPVEGVEVAAATDRGVDHWTNGSQGGGASVSGSRVVSPH